MVFSYSPLFSANSGTDTLKILAEPADIRNITVGGFLGHAIEISEAGRLMKLPLWDDGELINIFREEYRRNNKKTDWYGEHAGKWLYTVSQAVARTGNPELKKLLLQTADSLVSFQAADGYLGTYSPEQQLSNTSASHQHSWDIWNLSYMTLGLLKLHEYFPDPAYSEAAIRIGELFLRTFGDGKNPVTEYGTRLGISATIIIDPVVELYKLTKDKRYLDFAGLVIKQAEEKQGLQIISAGLNNTDMLWVGEGKAYQIIWNLTAIAKLYEYTGKKEYLTAVLNAWKNIKEQHLSINGGPWGGVGKFYESFNRGRFWNPYGFIETCSIMAWMQLNRELFKITSEAVFMDEFEKAAYNALLGAQYPDGIQWCYHSFTNGRRLTAHFNDCCPSSGALALEEIPGLIFTEMADGISLNLFEECRVKMELDGNEIMLSQETNFPFDGEIILTVNPQKKMNFPLYIRIPEWAGSVKLSVNGEALETDKLTGKSYYKFAREWKKNDRIKIVFPMNIRISRKLEHALKPQGGKDLYQVHWYAFSRGPLNYAANGLLEGENREKVLKLPEENPEKLFVQVKSPDGMKGPAYELQLKDKKPFLFLPFYEAGGRKIGSWRLTWLQDEIE